MEDICSNTDIFFGFHKILAIKSLKMDMFSLSGFDHVYCGWYINSGIPVRVLVTTISFNTLAPWFGSAKSV